MDKIARAANVAKGTLYYNYAPKSALFSAAVIIGQIREALSLDLPFHQTFEKTGGAEHRFVNLIQLLDAKCLQRTHQRHRRRPCPRSGSGLYPKSRPEAGRGGVVGLVEHLCVYHLGNRHRLPQKAIEVMIYTFLVDGLCIDK